MEVMTALATKSRQQWEYNSQTRESLQKRKAQYIWTPRTNWYRPAAFNIQIFFSFLQNKYLNKEVNCTNPSPSVMIPWLNALAYYEKA